MTLTPEQCRAARGLLGWTQAALAAVAGVGTKTVADFERGAGIPYDDTLGRLEQAFVAAGVDLIPENGGGAGARLTRPAVKLARRRVSCFDCVASFHVAYRGREFHVRLSANVFDNIDQTNHESDVALERAFDRHRGLILARTAAAIDAGRAEGADLVLTVDDFPEGC